MKNECKEEKGERNRDGKLRKKARKDMTKEKKRRKVKDGLEEGKSYRK